MKNPLPRSSWIKIAAFVMIFSGVCWLLFLSPAGAMLASADGRAQLLARMNALVSGAGPLGPLVFIGVMIVGLLFLPATPFVLAGTLLFGKFAGSLYNFVAAMAAAAISFVLGRYFLHGLAHRLLSGKLAGLNAKAEAHGFSVVFYLRLAWFPFIVLNYGAGASRIRFGDYIWGTLLGSVAPFFIASFCYGSFWEIARTYQSPADLATFDVLFPVALIIFSLFLPRIVRRFRKGALPENGAV
ncbi:MAG TPA: VTT domain-containing protein [Candidatus Deferrimicrobiaceae bacterium]|jgi:uncharacterized membrane protein YdjX (TVP38/TMEM64 family)